jgi:hypothetical protein
MNQLIRRPSRPLGAKRLIGDLDESRLIAGRLDHPIKLGLLSSLGGGLQLASANLQLPSEANRLLNVIVIHQRILPRALYAGYEGAE